MLNEKNLEMSDISLSKFSNVYMRVSADEGILKEIYDHFSVYAKDYRYSPKFKNHIWDGKINFFKGRQRLLGTGLLDELLKFADACSYSVSMTDELKESLQDTSVTKDGFLTELSDLDLSAYGEKIQLRDYQMLGIYSALRNKRRVFVSNTSSGKSAIIYGITRLVLPRLEGKVLIIVPTTNLVEQMYADFVDYSSDDSGWDVSDNCSRLYSSYEYDGKNPVLISTWQSLQKKPADFFEQFSCVVVDESHSAKAAVLSKILGFCINADYRFGFTGTLPKDRCEEYSVLSMLGKRQTLSTTKDAIERGYVSKLKIYATLLRHELTRDLRNMSYMDEIDYLCTLEERTDFICALANSLPGNTIILTARVDTHGKVIYDKLCADPNGKEIFQIFGDVKVKDRECIRQTMEEKSNCITVGNFQCIQQGWSVRNLDNLIFAFPSKSSIRVIQSIGRILRKSEGKETATLYDIGDAFVKRGNPVESAKNHTFNHFKERLGIYSEEGHDYEIAEFNISNYNFF